MHFNMYAIYDSAADAYLPPFILPREAMAIRSFAQAVNSETHQFHHSPADFTLFQIASWDDAEGIPKPDVAPKKIRNGLELLGLTEEEATDGPHNGKAQANPERS